MQLIINGQGATIANDLYKPFGDLRYTYKSSSSLALQTPYRYTSQRMEVGVGAPSPVGGLERGLYFYGARWYDPSLARFIQPDTIIPNPGNPGGLNRFAYVLNNPLRYSDPTGHAECEDTDCTRVLHPVTGKLVRRQPAPINWASIPEAVQFIYQELLANAKGGTVSQLANLNTQCMGCTVSAISGAQSAAQMVDRGARLKAKAIFAWKVRQGGEWDPKPKLVTKFGKKETTTYWNQLQKGNGPAYYYDVWGNIEYGYLGTASAFSADALLEGAGAEQIGSSLGYTVKERSLE